MMKLKNNKSSGLTLVEVMMGMAILTFIIAAAVVSLMTITKGITSSGMENKAVEQLRTAADMTRLEAVENFNSMGIVGVEEDYTADYLHNIRIFRTIGPVDPVLRIRSVLLEAKWYAASIEKSKTLAFDVSNIRIRIAGATIKLQALRENDGTPLARVQVVAPGQVTTRVKAMTDAEGWATLSGVLLSPTGVDVDVDGSPIRHYFKADMDAADPNYDAADPYAYSFAISSPTVDPTTDGLVYEFPNPFYLRPPGIIDGYVYDGDSGTSGAQKSLMYLVPKTMKVKYDLGEKDANQISVANGYYKFANVIPGTYYLYALGSDEYAAVGKPLDYFRLLNPEDPPFGVGEWDTADSVAFPFSQERNYRTIKKGSISGTVKGVDHNGTYFATDTGNTPAGMELRFLRSNRHAVFKYSVSYSTRFNFDSSTAWREFVQPTDLGYSEAILDSSGDYDVDYFTPAIVREAIHPVPAIGQAYIDGYAVKLYKHQNTVDVDFKNKNVGPPFTPILVYGPTGSPTPNSNWHLGAGGVNMVIRSTSPYFIEGTTTNPRNVLMAQLGLDVITNTDNSFNLYLLERGDLGNVKVNALTDGTDPFDPTSVSKSQISVRWAEGGYGAVKKDASDNAYVVRDYGQPISVTPFVLGTGDSSFLGLPPNAGDPSISEGKTKIIYEGWNESTPSTTFGGKVKAYKKIRVDLPGLGPDAWEPHWVEVDSAELDFGGGNKIPVKYWYYNPSDGWEFWWSNNMSVSNGVIQNFNRNAKKYNLYRGDEDIRIEPSLTADVSITNITQNDVYPIVYFEVTWGQCNPTSPYAFNHHPKKEIKGSTFTYNAGLGRYDGDLELLRMSQAKIVYGKVLELVGSEYVPLEGVDILLKRTGGYPVGQCDYEDLTFKTVRDACKDDTKFKVSGLTCPPDSQMKGEDYQFIFVDGKAQSGKIDPLNFIMTRGDNLMATAYVAGFEPRTKSTEAYEDMSWRVDFVFIRPAEGGTGAASGGIGSGL